jgi:polyphosphate kinase
MAASNVMFGIPGLKVHSKLLLVQRREEGGDRYYTHVGTGNFNEKTARLYTDFSLLTYDQEIGREVRQVFEFLRYTYRRMEYDHLLVSPHTSRPAWSGEDRSRDRAARGAARGDDAQVQQPG